MRLSILEHGHRRRQRIGLRLTRLFMGVNADDVVKMSFYRPEFFGRPWLALVRSVMRGPSAWTSAERELFGAFVSRLNACRYCAGIHTNAAALGGLPSETMDQTDPRQDSIAPPLRAALGLLEKMTVRPDDLVRADIDAVRAAGVSDQAIEDALYVGFVFNTINRLANALDFDWGDEDTARRIAVAINRYSYRIPDFWFR